MPKIATTTLNLSEYRMVDGFYVRNGFSLVQDKYCTETGLPIFVNKRANGKWGYCDNDGTDFYVDWNLCEDYNPDGIKIKDDDMGLCNVCNSWKSICKFLENDKMEQPCKDCFDCDEGSTTNEEEEADDEDALLQKCIILKYIKFNGMPMEDLYVLLRALGITEVSGWTKERVIEKLEYFKNRV